MVLMVETNAASDFSVIATAWNGRGVELGSFGKIFGRLKDDGTLHGELDTRQRLQSILCCVRATLFDRALIMSVCGWNCFSQFPKATLLHLEEPVEVREKGAMK
jgi:hypothetical protein